MALITTSNPRQYTSTSTRASKNPLDLLVGRRRLVTTSPPPTVCGIALRSTLGGYCIHYYMVNYQKIQSRYNDHAKQNHIQFKLDESSPAIYSKAVVSKYARMGF